MRTRFGKVPGFGRSTVRTRTDGLDKRDSEARGGGYAAIRSSFVAIPQRRSAQPNADDAPRHWRAKTQVRFWQIVRRGERAFSREENWEEKKGKKKKKEVHETA